MRRLLRQSAEHRLECLIRVLSGYSRKHFSTVGELILWFERHVETRRFNEASRISDPFKKDSLCMSVFFVKRIILGLRKEGFGLTRIMKFLYSTSLLIEKETNHAP